MLMSLAALPQTDAPRRMMVAATLGYGRMAGFALTVAPALYRQLRLPVYAVLAYGMTSVDMAMILGPTLPHTLAVQVGDWFTDPGLDHRAIAAAGAAVQVALVGAALVVWRLAEAVAAGLVQRQARAGRRWRAWDGGLAAAGQVMAWLAALALLAGLAGLALWSVAGLWTFPNAVPDALTLSTWRSAAPGLGQAMQASLLLAVVSTGLALVMVLAWVQADHVLNLSPHPAALWLLYLPLIAPQVSFLPGLAQVTLRLGAQAGNVGVVLAHLTFVLPYVYLSLAPAFRAWDRRYGTIAAALGASETRIFLRLRLPMLLAPVMTAAALGMAVSIGQYLATLLVGGGRIATLTTEALALSSGGNHRVIGAYGLLQTVLPALGFALALTLPRMFYANRRGMSAT